MNHQLAELGADLDAWVDVPKDLDAAASKIKCELEHGLRVRWYYTDDKRFYEEEGMDPRVETVYSGLIVAKPDVEPRGLEITDCVLIIESYPVEKENCRVDWVALGRLFDADDLVELFADERKELWRKQKSKIYK